MLRVVLVAMLLTAGIEVAKAADPVEFKIGYLRTAKPRTAISLVDVPPENNGLAGAQAATADNNTTGITSTINVGATGTIVSRSVRGDITHTFQAHLEPSSIGPEA